MVAEIIDLLALIFIVGIVGIIVAGIIFLVMNYTAIMAFCGLYLMTDR